MPSNISVRPRGRRCEAMTLRRRPRAGGDPYAAATRCGGASDGRNLGGNGSPPARGRQRLGSCQRLLSTHWIPAEARAWSWKNGVCGWQNETNATSGVWTTLLAKRNQCDGQSEERTFGKTKPTRPHATIASLHNDPA